MSPLDLAIVVGGLVIAGSAKGLAGMGLPLVATPILAGVFGPRAAVVIIAFPILVANTMLLIAGWRRIPAVIGEIVPILLAGAVGTIVGVSLLAQLDQRVFAIVISGLVALFLLRGERILGTDPSARRIRVAGPLIGLIGGGLQGSTSIASPIVGGYFHTRQLAPADFVVVLAALFQLNSIVQIGGFVAYDLLTPDLLALGLIAIVPTLLGLIAGIELRGRISAERFRQLVVVMLVLSVGNLLWRTFVA